MTLAMFYRCADGMLIRLDCVAAAQFFDAVPDGSGNPAWRLMFSGGSWVTVSQDDYTAIVEMLEKRVGLV